MRGLPGRMISGVTPGKREVRLYMPVARRELAVTGTGSTVLVRDRVVDFVIGSGRNVGWYKYRTVDFDLIGPMTGLCGVRVM